MARAIDVDKKCTGCNLCVSVCYKNAIELKITDEGFWYPEVKDECVDCGACRVMCPVYGGHPEGFRKPTAYAAWNNDDAVRFESSSGGMFSMLAENVIKKQGAVYGAAYDKDNMVSHIRVDELADIAKLRGSKCVQSFISKDIYISLKKDLEDGKKVLFSGTPCQTAGVSKCFGRHDNLITVDIICHGVPSPKAWKSYLNEIDKKGKIKKINMRSKKYGWNKFHMIIQYENGACDDSWFNDNPWGKSFVRNMFLRESCYNCKFKEYIRCADISLGDFWEAARGEHTEFDDNDKGTSVVLINSEKGEKAFRVLDCYSSEIPYEWIPEKTYAVYKSSERNEKREKAFADLSTKTFSKVVDKYVNVKFSTRVKNKIKRIVKKVMGMA